MKLRPFELALVIFFAFMGIAALVILGTFSSETDPKENPAYVGPVEIWGTLPAGPMNDALAIIRDSDEEFRGVTYRAIAPEEFNETLVEAIADEAGPDIILTSHESLIEQRNRIRVTSYETLPLRDFQDTYLDGAQIFALIDGTYGVPFLVDPLMMYWNKDILTNSGFLTAPRTWEELVNVQLPAMVDRSFDRSINRGVVAFGVYDNTEHAYGVLSTLLIQGGAGLVSEREKNSSIEYDVNLTEDAIQSGANPLISSLNFYLRFSQPANTLYSWNRSFSSDLTEFIAGDLVFYFGYGSEGRVLEELNPNLNFDIAEVPQGVGAEVRRTYGQFYALSPLRSSDNLNGTFNVINRLTSDAALQFIAERYNMVPSKRSLVAGGSDDIFTRIAYRSAPIAYGWLNPEISATEVIFSDAVSDISENRSTTESAAFNSETKLSRLYE